MNKHDAAYEAMQTFMAMNEQERNLAIGFIKGVEAEKIIRDSAAAPQGSDADAK